jgi:hypothetical protein
MRTRGCMRVCVSTVSERSPLDFHLELGVDAEIKGSAGKGLGAFCTHDVKKGQLITHYASSPVQLNVPVVGVEHEPASPVQLLLFIFGLFYSCMTGQGQGLELNCYN